MENIDDDCDKYGITFVKTEVRAPFFQLRKNQIFLFQDFKIAKSYGITDFPSLVYFEHNTPNVFEGDFINNKIKNVLNYIFIPGNLKEEEEVLQWVITQKVEDRIELITRNMMETMVEEVEYMAVYFCKLQKI